MMLSDCATAIFVESGLKAMDLIMYDFLPVDGSCGFVENLSRRSPFSSNKRICLSDVATASFKLFGAQARPHILFS